LPAASWQRSRAKAVSPPLLIDPVDFVQLYQQQYRRAQEAAAASGQAPPPQDA
jgi:preprotein translocase subunit SecB